MDKTAKIRMKAKRNVTDLAGEKVMVDFEQGKYFCIKGVGNDIWDMLDGQEGEDGITVEAILHKLMEEYEVMEEGSSGFLGFNAKPARIKAKVKETVEDKARAFLDDVFAAMHMTVLVEVSFNEEEKVMDIELKGDDMGVLIGKRGQTLDSLQYLVSLVVNRDSDEGNGRISQGEAGY